MKAFFCAFVLAAPIVGQTVTASAVLQQPLTVTVIDVNGTPSSQTIPLGTPLVPMFAHVATSAGNATVFGQSASTRTEASLGVLSIMSASPGCSASAVPCDALCSFTASAPTPVRVEVEWSLQASGGVSFPLVEVDIGNNGTLEYQGHRPETATLAHLTLGTTPLVARLRVQTGSTGGWAIVSVTLRVVPDPALTLLSTPTCSPILSARPAFDGALDLVAVMGNLDLLVIGLSAQPVALPSPTPCLLIPARDAIVPMPNGRLQLRTAGLQGVPLWMQVAYFQGDFVSASAPLFVLYQ